MTVDVVQQPLQVVDSLYRAASQPTDDNSFSILDTIVTNYSGQSSAQQVPIVTTTTNFDAIPDGILVKVVGMVQQTTSPELYVGWYQVGNQRICTKLSDRPPPPEASDQAPPLSSFWERNVVTLVPLPGIQPWAAGSQGTSETTEAAPGADAEGSMDIDRQTVHQLACFTVLAYENLGQQLQRIGQVVEVIGVLQKAPHLGAGLDDEAPVDTNESGNIGDGSSHPLPTSGTKTVRIHAILANPIQQPATWLLPPSVAGQRERLVADAGPRSGDRGLAEQAREMLLKGLTWAFEGDELAATYLLLQLVSTVSHAEAADGSPARLGVLNPNFVLDNQQALDGRVASNVGRVMADVVPLFCQHAVNLEWLSSPELFPRFSDGYVLPGALHVANGTHLLLDESRLTSGGLQETGLRNLQALQTMLNTQTIALDCGPYPITLRTCTPTTIISAGRTLLRASCPIHVPVIPSPQLPLSFPAWDVELVRAWAAAVTCVGGGLSFAEDAASVLETWFVAARKDDEKKTWATVEVLSTLAEVARLLAASMGAAAVDVAACELAIQMEETRQKRTQQPADGQQDRIQTRQL